MNIILSRLLTVALALFAGCSAIRSTTAARNGLVTIQATVEVFDEDGVVFDLDGSPIDLGTMSRSPLARIVVTDPVAYAGRRCLVAFSETSTVVGERNFDELKTVGAKVTLNIPEACLAFGPRRIIEISELKRPCQTGSGE